jgi:hypothetical protein
MEKWWVVEERERSISYSSCRIWEQRLQTLSYFEIFQISNFEVFLFLFFGGIGG